jgi:hypothetical protein
VTSNQRHSYAYASNLTSNLTLYQEKIKDPCLFINRNIYISWNHNDLSNYSTITLFLPSYYFGTITNMSLFIKSKLFS